MQYRVNLGSKESTQGVKQLLRLRRDSPRTPERLPAVQRESQQNKDRPGRTATSLACAKAPLPPPHRSSQVEPPHRLPQARPHLPRWRGFTSHSSREAQTPRWEHWDPCQPCMASCSQVPLACRVRTSCAYGKRFAPSPCCEPSGAALTPVDPTLSPGATSREPVLDLRGSRQNRTTVTEARTDSCIDR